MHKRCFPSALRLVELGLTVPATRHLRLLVASAACLILLAPLALAHEKGHSGFKGRDTEEELARRDRGRDSEKDRRGDLRIGQDQDRGRSRQPVIRTDRVPSDPHPPGWNHGRKTGWGDHNLPPGQAKKVAERDRNEIVFTRRHDAIHGRADHGTTRGEFARFSSFLGSHPTLQRSLQRDPSLINNRAFLSRNPSLRSWLSDHPATANEVRQNPRAFLNHERIFEESRLNSR